MNHCQKLTQQYFEASISARNIRRPALCLAWVLACSLAPRATSVFAGIGRRGANATENDQSRATRPSQDAHNDRHGKLIEKFLAWYFVLCHLVTALLYLYFSYDPTGTYAPAWTNPLD
jgi:hypothetical protein